MGYSDSVTEANADGAKTSEHGVGGNQVYNFMRSEVEDAMPRDKLVTEGSVILNYLLSIPISALSKVVTTLLPYQIIVIGILSFLLSLVAGYLMGYYWEKIRRG